MDAQPSLRWRKYDSGKNLVKLFGNARVKRGRNIVISSTLVWPPGTKPLLPMVAPAERSHQLKCRAGDGDPSRRTTAGQIGQKQ